MRRSTLPLLALAGLAFTAGAARAQDTSTPQQTLEVGAVAPDFALPGATRYGTLAEPVRLSDFSGKTVVIAFFPRARTKG